MADSKASDPHTWDVERLIHELCGGTNQPWVPFQTSKRLDPVTLAQALREKEIDGEMLLSWEDVFSSLDSLFRDLAISKPAQKMTLARAVAYLKKRSPAYHKAKAEQLAMDQEPDLLADEDFQLQDGAAAVTLHEPIKLQVPSKTNQIEPQHSGIRTAMMSPASDQPQQQAESSPKKKRLAPQLVSTELSYAGRAPLPTAADAFTVSPRYSSDAFKNRPNTAYLGAGRLVLSELVPRTSLRRTDLDDTSDVAREFSLTCTGRMPSGRRLQIHRSLKRLLQFNSKAQRQIKDDISPHIERDASPAYTEDRLLPCFGDSDDEDKAYDSETVREMMEEDSESNVEPGILAYDEVDAVLDDAVQKLRDNWEEKKLPRCVRKSHQLWNQARRAGRNTSILQASKRVAALETRQTKLRAEIQSQGWTSKNNIRNQARCLDATVEDHCYFSWLVNMLQGREPPKLKSAPRSRPPRDRTARVVNLSDEEGQLILSETDSSDEDFVVDDPMDDSMDGPANDAMGDPMDASVGYEPDSDGSALESIVPRQTVPKQESPNQPSNVIDLTGADGDSEPSQRGPERRDSFVNLVTPNKSLPSQAAQVSSPADLALTPEQLGIPFNKPEEIGAIKLQSWAFYKDGQRLIVCYLWNKGEAWRDQLFELVRTKDSDEIWNGFVLPACQNTTSSSTSSPGSSAPGLNVSLARLFWQYSTSELGAGPFYKVLGNKIKTAIPRKRGEFDGFLEFLRQHVIPHFNNAASGGESTGRGDSDSAGAVQKKNVNGDEDDDGDDTDSDEPEDELTNETPSRTRKRRIKRDEEAQQKRTEEASRRALNDARTGAFLNRLAKDSSISSVEARLIINASKEGDDNTGFISVTPFIADRIKDHQIDGVRFMWNQIIANQGCLLAHTMGLGKTMQIITLLVAIVEAGNSQDPAANSQIPVAIKKPKTLILCPAGLVENWLEEFYSWSPPDVFRKDVNVFFVDSSSGQSQRSSLVRSWNSQGGVFISGYEMFKNVIKDREMERILTEEPTIVVADEAHRMKNQSSQLGQASIKFKTQRRLALTGSPLANNVEEFFSMIDWAAPNFLGPSKEFKAVYAEPIHKGLWGDSTPYQYRKAKKMLAALEKTVSPKTHRLTIKSLKDELPDKKEFILTTPLTDLQRKLYDMYIDSVKERAAEIKQAQTFTVMNNLTLICNHPRCFQQKLQRERNRLEGIPVSQPAEDDAEGPPDGPDGTFSQAFLTQSLRILNRDRDLNSIDHSWKVKHLVAILDESRARKEKVLVFSQSIPTLNFLDNLLRQQSRLLVKLTGNTKSSIRQNMVKEFNRSNLEIFLISTNAGGIGLNITGASRVVIFDFKFNPVSEQQAIGRAYRIGQRNPVFVYRFVSGGTFEMILHNKAVFKMQLASRVVDKENPKRWSTKLGEFLQTYQDPPQESLAEFRKKDKVLDKVLSTSMSGSEPAVRSIVQTDTFEEEDPNDVDLDPEERKEVESLTKMNQLRNTDPEEYRRLECQLNTLQRAQQMQALSTGLMTPGAPLPATNFGTHSFMGFPAPTNESTFQGANANQPFRFHNGYPLQLQSQPQGQPQRQPQGHPQQGHPQQGHPLQGHPQGHSQGQSQGQPSVSAQPKPPMTAAGGSAYNGHTSAPPPPKPPTPVATNASRQQPPRQNNTLSEAALNFERSLIETALANEIPAERRAPSKIRQTTLLINDVRKQRRAGLLPDKHHWNLLKRLVETDMRFTTAYFQGLFTTDELADENVDKRVRELGRLSSAEFQQTLVQDGSRRSDPDHLRNALQRSNRSATNSDDWRSSPRAKEDIMAMREVADRRKKRVPKLPSWASRAVEDKQ